VREVRIIHSFRGMVIIPAMNEDEMSIRHLKALSLMLELKSLTRVAEVLGTNQPTVSKILSKLRRYFGDPLFVRVGLSMNPTPRALEIAAPLHGLLAVSEILRSSNVGFNPAISTREFRILAAEIGMINLVPIVMRELERAGASLRLRAVPLDARHVSAKLEAGEADIALGAFPKEAGTLRRQKLYVDLYVSVVRNDHPRLDRLSKADAYLRERHIIVTASNIGHAAHQQLEDALISKIDPERIQLRVPSFVACAFVASQTNAVGTMPARLAERLVKNLPIAIFTPPLALPRIEISQIWHERVHQDAGHRWLRSKIYELFRTGRPAS
jgi:DNA-binding transcriptional LysR family regulator